MMRVGVAAFAGVLALTTVAFAAVITDVAHVSNMRPGSRVTLHGNIVQHIRSDYYKFQDGTGSIRIEMERWVTRGRSFHPTDKVEISGEVSRALGGNRYIEVSRVRQLK